MPIDRRVHQCIYADPPYIFPGRSMNYYGARGGHDLVFHTELRDALFASGLPFVLSINDAPEARELYSGADSITSLCSGKNSRFYEWVLDPPAPEAWDSSWERFLDCGPRFFLAVLRLADGHFLGVLCAVLHGLATRRVAMGIQGLFGTGKTFCASAVCVLLGRLCDISCLFVADANLPLQEFSRNVRNLLREGSEECWAAFPRMLRTSALRPAPGT